MEYRIEEQREFGHIFLLINKVVSFLAVHRVLKLTDVARLYKWFRIYFINVFYWSSSHISFLEI